MMKVTILEFFVRGIPEGFLLILAAYAFSKVSIDFKKCFISGLAIAIIGFITRSLPIHYGVHTILNLFAFIILAVNINKLDLIKSIQTGIIMIILQFVCEAINVLLIQYVFKVDIGYVFNNPTAKTLYGIPSTLIFASIVTIYYFKISKRKELNKESDGKISA